MTKTKEERQAIRLKFISQLDKMLKEAYSGVTCMEYDAIKVARNLMKTVYDRERCT